MVRAQSLLLPGISLLQVRTFHSDDDDRLTASDYDLDSAEKEILNEHSKK